jgi:hypothetical protein
MKLAGKRSALEYSRKATAAVLAHRTAESTRQTEAAGGLVEQRASYFQRHVANLAVLYAEVGRSSREALEMAQWASISAAAAPADGHRFASGWRLAALVRRQDLAAAWRDKDRHCSKRFDPEVSRTGQGSPPCAEIAETEGGLRSAARIDKEFPDYPRCTA